MTTPSPSVKQHPSTCPECGLTIPHYGARDLAKVVREAEALLRPRPSATSSNAVEALIECDVAARAAWVELACAVHALDKRCAPCADPSLLSLGRAL